MRAKRTILLSILIVALLLTFAGSALAYPLVNVPATHQAATLNVINNRPGLLALVLSVYPGFYVRGGWGTMAWPGSIDVCTARTSDKTYTDHVAHEWAHEVNHALDALGKNCTGRYQALLASKGWTVNQIDSWHSFAECLSQYYFGPYYANPATTLYLVSKRDMGVMLADMGVVP